MEELNGLGGVVHALCTNLNTFMTSSQQASSKLLAQVETLLHVVIPNTKRCKSTCQAIFKIVDSSMDDINSDGNDTPPLPDTQQE